MVTGAAHGIGRACATRLASEGALVAVTDLDRSAAEEVAAGLPGAPGHTAYAMDVIRTDEVEAVFAAIAERFGHLDVLVNVAGGDTAHGSFENTDDETWQRMFDLNLLGVVRCCRAAVPHLRSSKFGPSIVTVTSINAHVALGREPYSAAKAGVASLTQNLAASLGPEGIRVNAVAPGDDPDPELGRPAGWRRPDASDVCPRPGRRTRRRRGGRRLPGLRRRGLGHRARATGGRWPVGRHREPAVPRNPRLTRTLAA